MMRGTRCAMKKLGALSILVTMLALALVAHAQQTEIIAGGELEYQRNCVVCHGIDGRGDGIMGKYLTVPLSDLRQITKNNGGKFPFGRCTEKLTGKPKCERMEHARCRYGAIAFVRRLGVTEVRSNTSGRPNSQPHFLFRTYPRLNLPEVEPMHHD